ALANQLGLDDKQYYTFRELAVEFLINNPQLHDSALEPGETIQGRMEGLLMNAWGGDESIIAAAEAFEVQIYVHTPQGTVTKFGKEQKNKQPLHLGYVNHNHYVSLQKK
ncbi:MAG: hypothetical protein EZS28_016418, partial [Streblomastix strix]